MSRSRYWAVASLCLYSSITGCATVGEPFDTARVTTVHKGQSRGEIVSRFGEPTLGNKVSLADGAHKCVKRYRYNFANATESHVLWIDFDSRDTVCNVLYSSGPS